MKLKQTLGTLLLTVGVAASASANEKTAKLNEFNDFQVRLLEATDHRDSQNPVFDDALLAGKWEALVYLGQIGGVGCEKIRPYLVHVDAEARRAAAIGAAFCHDKGLEDALEDAAASGYGAADLLSAMGYSGGASTRRYLIDQINDLQVNAVGSDGVAALFGLLQSVAYDQVAAADLEGLDYANLVSLTRNRDVGYAAAYLMGRVQNVEEVVPQQAIEAALRKAPTSPIMRALTRVLRSYGDAAAETLMTLVAEDDQAVAMEAVRSLGSMGDSASLMYLKKIARDGSVPMRHLAISALAGRNLDDDATTDLVAGMVADDNPWVSVSALRSLNGRDAERTLGTAKAWLMGKDYYRAFSAMALLSGSDAGKKVLHDYAKAHPDTIRGREAAIALDPSIEAIESPRATPGWNLVRSYQDRELVLETTRGTICIAPSAEAPYAAANYMLLADTGRMNGMLWHRVIPNFVAQAGQVETPEIADWGMIREEWQGSVHEIGAVGVATAGRDTGGTQFFIDTAYNMHLNNRYTVIGHVMRGLDVAFKLQEGDVITRAETVKANGCQ